MNQILCVGTNLCVSRDYLVHFGCKVNVVPLNKQLFAYRSIR